MAKATKRNSKTDTSTNGQNVHPNSLIFQCKDFPPRVRDEDTGSNSSHCLSFKSISTGKTLPRWLKIMKSGLAGKETILHPRRQTLVIGIQIVP